MSVDIAKRPKGANYPWFRAAILDYSQSGITLELCSSGFQYCSPVSLFVCLVTVLALLASSLPFFLLLSPPFLPQPLPLTPQYRLIVRRCSDCLVQSVLRGLLSGGCCSQRDEMHLWDLSSQINPSCFHTALILFSFLGPAGSN